jgi:AcrR family transcriptional regulator
VPADWNVAPFGTVCLHHPTNSNLTSSSNSGNLPSFVSTPAPLRVPVQSRSQRTRAALVNAARVEFGRKGYTPTTAKSIAERANAATGTFYHYFPDKDAVLREIARERVAYLLDRSSPLSEATPIGGDLGGLAHEARRRLRGLVELYVSYHRADRGLHSVITERRLCDPDLDAIMSASEREAVQRLRRALDAWGHGGDTEAAAFMSFSLLEGAVHGHVLTQAMLTDERFTEGLVEALIRIGAPQSLFQIPAHPKESP